MNSLGPNLWISHDWEYRYAPVGHRHLKTKGRGCGSENQSVSGVPTICLMQRDTSPLHRVDQAVDCSLWNVVPLFLNGWVKMVDIGRTRASQTCPMGNMSGEYAGHGRTGTFSASRNCVQILVTWGCALSCWNMRWWQRMNGTTMGLKISSRYLCAFKLPLIKGNYVRCL